MMISQNINSSICNYILDKYLNKIQENITAHLIIKFTYSQKTFVLKHLSFTYRLQKKHKYSFKFSNHFSLETLNNEY